MNPIFFNTFFRSGDGAGVAATATRGGVVTIRINSNVRDFLPIGQAFLVELEGLKDEDGEYENAIANMTVTVKNSVGTEMVTPQDMDYVTGSNGTYRGTIPGSLALEDGVEYTVFITTGDGAVNRAVDAFAQYHGEV